MAVDDDIRALSHVSLFEGLAREHLRLLAFGSDNLHFHAGEILYREGDKAECAYVIVGGSVVLFRERQGDMQELAVMGKGALLGEMALINDTTRMTSARADTTVDLITINRKLFRRLLEEYPVVAARLHQRIALDLQDLVGRITALGPRFG
ncbi:MAG: cyclic nucleotide-binding domain-containing protein [Aliihoeflea sp.]|jgi:CRP-like cAMP-binding protein